MASVGNVSAPVVEVTRSVPGGGINGQVLTKQSPTEGDYTWTPRPSLGGNPPIPSGQWFSNIASAADPTATVNINHGALTAIYHPFWVDAATAITSLALFQSSATTALTMNVAILAADADGGDPGPLVMAPVAVSVTNTTSTPQQLTQIVSATIPPGWNYFAIGNTHATSTFNVAGPGGTSGAIERTPLGANPSANGVRPIYTMDFNSSGIPRAFPGGVAYYHYAPSLWFRVA